MSVTSSGIRKGKRGRDGAGKAYTKVVGDTKSETHYSPGPALHLPIYAHTDHTGNE